MDDCDERRERCVADPRREDACGPSCDGMGICWPFKERCEGGGLVMTYFCPRDYLELITAPISQGSQYNYYRQSWPLQNGRLGSVYAANDDLADDFFVRLIKVFCRM